MSEKLLWMKTSYAPENPSTQIVHQLYAHIFLTMVLPMSVNKCLSNSENMKICFASNNSFSDFEGV